MTRICAVLLLSLCVSFAAEKVELRPVGAARVDITPDTPIRLSGYLARKTESTNAAQRLYAKALAIGSDKDGPAILLTVDSIGVPAHVRDELVRRLAKKKIRPESVAICATHSHTAPHLAGNLPTLFGEPIPPEHQANIDRYTKKLIDALEKVSLAALRSRRPAKLEFGLGKAAFAANRRTKGGPVDHDLPVLAVRDARGKLRAVLANYACHCTTLGPEFNESCGDWAGYAQEYLEEEFSGAIALVAIGCGADSNPQPRPGLEFAKQHGREMADGVADVLAGTLDPVHSALECRAKQIEIALESVPTREEWEQKAKENTPAGYQARYNLAKLDRGETIPGSFSYLVQAWNFGDRLAMVFLPGEVVVDYALRLKKEFDPDRIWVNAYANDVPCYIASERILREGGYEGGGAMIYYDKPSRLAPGVEDRIINTVHELLPKEFLFDEKKAEFPPPLSPEEALRAMRTKPGLRIELVAAEPLIVDPVAIDWGADGKLWVAEMHDYPTGIDGNWKPGGRIKFLEDKNGDGRYDRATLFLDGLPFPTGVTAWRNGALICAAPDILYAEDTDGDGKADAVKKIFSGFVTENYQARVNSLAPGLDNWIYGANGLLGGAIQGIAGGKSIDIRGRDFRMNPDTGAFEPASGLTQQGRARDDWGNWFGCDNSTLGWHFPLPDHYVRRNPHVTAPGPRVAVASGPDPNLLHPISRTLERFNRPESANRVTSACGLGVYRDDLLGAEFSGNLFVAESVHNLVRRLVPQADGVTIKGARADNEQTREFLASRDNWFRPAQVRTGPDGALYVVDMYRFVIEHPRWIPAERLATLDVRAGDDKGRIYRIVPANGKPRPIQNLRTLSTSKLVAALDTPNGTTRDLVHLELTQRGDKAAIRPLKELANKATLPAVRLQAACVLDGLNAVTPALLTRQFSDAHAAVRANAIRLSEVFLRPPSPRPSPPGRGGTPSPESAKLKGSQYSKRTGDDSSSPGVEGRGEGGRSSNSLTDALLKLIDDPELSVRYQLALSLGEWADPRAGEALGRIAVRDVSDSWMRAAVLSSATRHPAEILTAVLAADSKTSGRAEMIGQLIATAAGEGDSTTLRKIIALIAPGETQPAEVWQLTALSSLLDALERKKVSLTTLESGANARLAPLFDRARALATKPETKDSTREPAIRLLGRVPERQPQDLPLLVSLLEPARTDRTQRAALETLKRIRSTAIPGLLFSNWQRRSPSLRQGCIEILLSREEWLGELFGAIENGTVGLNEISPTDRQRLLKHPNDSIRQRAETIFKATESSRAEILARYHPATSLPGDVAKGADVFAKNCASCHALRGQGHDVGPNLAALADKTPADLLPGILDPNAVVEPRFVAYDIETRDGRSLSGIVSAETATTLTLVQGGGARESILRNDIAEMRASGFSLMPEGLEQAISTQEMADLIAYLKTSPAPFGSATPEKAEAARKSFLAGGMNGVEKIISSLDQLPYPGWMGTLPMPYCRQTDGNAKLIWQTASVPADLKPEAVHQFRLPVGMGYVSQPAGKFSLRLNGRHLLDFNVTLNDQTWHSSDGKTHMSYTVMENNAEDSNGILLISVAGALLESGKPATFEVIGSASQSQRWFGIYQVPTGSPAVTQNLSLAEKILSDATLAKEREAIINSHPELSAQFLRELTADLTPGTAEEYRRIPWIWCVTVAAGKRNDSGEIVRILELSLPKAKEPLRDWQAVVIGGGIINGIGLVGEWPKERVESLLQSKPDLLARWQRANALASAMADDEKVKTGTRYDALRMIAMNSWEESGAQLVKYLAKGVNAELQQGAISGLSDMRSPEVAPALLSGLGHYSARNREFAFDALLRDETRIETLLDEIEAGRIKMADLGEQRMERLKNLKSETLAARVRTLVLK